MSRPVREVRISVVLHLLARRGELPVRLLPEVLRVSAATVRRDLAVMEDEGLIRRSYGRVVAARRGEELPMSLRRTRNIEAKRRIGILASSLIPSGALTVALGGGSTVRFVAEHLAGRTGLTVVTNSLDTAMSLMARQVVDVRVTGGTARPLSHDLVGEAAERALRSHRFDFAVVGADGISPEGGLTRHSARAAETDRLMLERAARRIVVADSSKLGRAQRARVAGVCGVDTVVTDAQADPDLLDALRRTGVEAVLVVMRPSSGPDVPHRSRSAPWHRDYREIP